MCFVFVLQIVVATIATHFGSLNSKFDIDVVGEIPSGYVCLSVLSVCVYVFNNPTPREIHLDEVTASNGKWSERVNLRTAVCATLFNRSLENTDYWMLCV